MNIKKFGLLTLSCASLLFSCNTSANAPKEITYDDLLNEINEKFDFNTIKSNYESRSVNYLYKQDGEVQIISEYKTFVLNIEEEIEMGGSSYHYYLKSVTGAFSILNDYYLNYLKAKEDPSKNLYLKCLSNNNSYILKLEQGDDCEEYTYNKDFLLTKMIIAQKEGRVESTISFL